MAPKPAEVVEEPPVVEEEAPPEPIVVPETKVTLIFTEEWVKQWFRKPSEKAINELFNLDYGEHGSFRDSVVSDFIYGNLIHARSICLQPLAGAIFCTIMMELIDRLTQQVSQKELFAHFSDRIQSHRKAGYFTINETYLMVDFVTTVLFKHFRLYSYCLTNPERMKRKFVYCMPLELPTLPPTTLEMATNISEKEREAVKQAKENARIAAEERQEKIRQGLIDPNEENQVNPEDAFDPRNLDFAKVDIVIKGQDQQLKNMQRASEPGVESAGTYSDPKFAQMIVPLEQQRYLEKAIAETETRINDMFAKVSSPKRPLEDWQN